MAESRRGTAVWRGTETKTRHCQPLRHRNRHPLRETLNHFYCIELSLLPAERTSKRVLSFFLSHGDVSLSLSLFLLLSSSRAFRQVIPGPRPSRPRLPAGYALFPFLPRLRRPSRDNTNAKAFTPLWLPKWNKFFNSRIYRRANESPAHVAEIIFGGRKRARLLGRTFRGASSSRTSDTSCSQLKNKREFLWVVEFPRQRERERVHLKD